MSEETEELPEEIVEEVSETSEPEVIEEESGTSEEPESKTGVQKRINKITSEKYEQQRRADALEKELADLKSVPAPVLTGTPKIEDFDYDESKFNEALINHKIEKGLAKQVEDQRLREDQQRQTQTSREFAQKVANSKIEGYSDVINDLIKSVPLSEGLVDAIMQDEKGPELAYYLGKHLDVADRLAASAPITAALELGKISAGLSGKKIKTVSNAPTPVQTVNSGAGAGKNYEKMSMEEIYNS